MDAARNRKCRVQRCRQAPAAPLLPGRCARSSTSDDVSQFDWAKPVVMDSGVGLRAGDSSDGNCDEVIPPPVGKQRKSTATMSV